MTARNAFLVDLRREENSPVVDRMMVRVGAIVWPFAQRLWRQMRGGTEMPIDMRPLMVLCPHSTGPIQEPPPSEGPAASGWTLSPRKDSPYSLVEFSLERRDEILSHTFYRLGDVFDRPLATLIEMLATRKELNCPPGHYFYDVFLGSTQGPLEREDALRKESEAFSEGSFELPLIDDGDPLLDFERLDDDPLLPALSTRVLFQVPGSHRLGETRFAAGAWEDLALTLPLSLDREIGGYLVGTVGEGDNGDETVTVTRAEPAELSAGDAHTLLLSPESGADIRQRLQKEWPDQELVGWYHTHVFSAENDILSGLSPTDETTHDEQFTRSWQLAVLVNVWRECGTVSRQVRVFRRNGDGKLIDVDYGVVEDGIGEGETP